MFESRDERCEAIRTTMEDMGFYEGEDFDEAQHNLYGDSEEEDFDEAQQNLYGDSEEDEHAFADPGGKSALRAVTKKNPRNLPCPTCEQPNRLTRIDRQHGYQCDVCADRTERGLD